MSDKFLIVGLGNPGREYRFNRHNIGFMLLDLLVERHALIGFTKHQGQALITTGLIAGAPVILAKPQTYMNLSGEAVSTLAHFYEVPRDRLLICYDDIDLPLGTIRLRPRGTAGGQRGMNSIIESLGSQHIPRLRIGIGHPTGERAAAAHVLHDVKGDEMEIINLALDRSLDAVESFIKDGIVLTMSRYNGPADRED